MHNVTITLPNNTVISFKAGDDIELAELINNLNKETNEQEDQEGSNYVLDAIRAAIQEAGYIYEARSLVSIVKELIAYKKNTSSKPHTAIDTERLHRICDTLNKSGGIIDAIVLIRSVLGVGLREAKLWFEERFKPVPVGAKGPQIDNDLLYRACQALRACSDNKDDYLRLASIVLGIPENQAERWYMGFDVRKV